MCTVRLVGSSNPRKGRLEMFYNRQWGTVCDDGFDDTAAGVICTSLGFGYVLYRHNVLDDDNLEANSTCSHMAGGWAATEVDPHTVNCFLVVQMDTI